MGAGVAFARSGRRKGWAAFAALAVAAGFVGTASAAPDRDITATWREPQDSTRVVKVTIRCKADCSVEIKGRLEIPRTVDPSTGEVTPRRTAKLKPVSGDLDAKRKERFGLRIPRKARPALENAFAAGETALARLKVLHSDTLGGSGRLPVKIELEGR